MPSQLPQKAQPATTTVSGYHSLSPEQKKSHRAKVALRVEAILSQFWRDDVHDAVRSIELEGYVDVLETCKHSEIRAAWAEYQRSGPRSRNGRLLRPDAGALYKIIVNRRPPPPKPAPEPVPKRKTISPEKRREILEGAGFSADGAPRFDMKKMPKGGIE